MRLVALSRFDGRYKTVEHRFRFMEGQIMEPFTRNIHRTDTKSALMDELGEGEGG